MKKILLLVTLSIVVFSCKKTEPEPESPFSRAPIPVPIVSLLEIEESYLKEKGLTLEGVAVKDFSLYYLEEKKEKKIDFDFSKTLEGKRIVLLKILESDNIYDLHDKGEVTVKFRVNKSVDDLSFSFERGYFRDIKLNGKVLDMKDSKAIIK